MRRIFMFIMMIAITLVTTGCDSSDDMITELKSKNCYEVDLLSSSKTVQHSMNLKKDNNIKVGIEKDGGKLSIRVCDKNGDVVYRGDYVKSSDFSIAVPEDGEYDLVVEGKRATGKVTFNTDGEEV